MEAVRKALMHVEGTYGIAVISKLSPGQIIAARKGSPLIIGVGKNERLVLWKKQNINIIVIMIRG